MFAWDQELVGVFVYMTFSNQKLTEWKDVGFFPKTTERDIECHFVVSDNKKAFQPPPPSLSHGTLGQWVGPCHMML